MRHICLAAIALISVAVPISAQSGAAQPGTTIRTKLVTGDPLTGTLIARTPDSLTIVLRGKDAIVKVANASIESLEVMNGRNHIAPAVKWGAIGGALWAVVAMAVPYDNCNVRRTEYCADSRAQFVATQAAGMAMMAGGIAAWKGEERWVRIEGSAPAPFVSVTSHSVAVGMRIRR